MASPSPTTPSPLVMRADDGAATASAPAPPAPPSPAGVGTPPRTSSDQLPLKPVIFPLVKDFPAAGPDLRLLDNGSGRKLLQGATIERMVDWLVRGYQPESNDKFIAAYRQIATPSELFQLLEDKFLQASKEHKGQEARNLRERVILFLGFWIERSLTRDFFEKETPTMLYNRLLNLLQTFTKYGFEEAAWSLKLLIIKTHRQRSLRWVGKRKRKKGEVKRLEKEKLQLGKFSFSDLDPERVAEQLTLYEFDRFSSISTKEFLNLSWKREDKKKTSRIAHMVERTNSMSFWVATTIILVKDLKARAEVVRKFIVLAEKCRELNNFNALMAVIGGLSNSAIQRLKQTWAEVPQRYVASFQQLNELMDNHSNYKNYRSALALTSLPAVPYLGVFLRDVTFIEEGNQNYMGERSEGVINFEKLELLGQVILEVQRFQTVGYNIPKDEALQSFLKKLLVLPEDALYKQSLALEPMNTPSASS